VKETNEQLPAYQNTPRNNSLECLCSLYLWIFIRILFLSLSVYILLCNVQSLSLCLSTQGEWFAVVGYCRLGYPLFFCLISASAGVTPIDYVGRVWMVGKRDGTWNGYAKKCGRQCIARIARNSMYWTSLKSRYEILSPPLPLTDCALIQHSHFLFCLTASQ